MKKAKVSKWMIAFGLLTISSGYDFYMSGWISKDHQPISKLGAVIVIIFGVAILLGELFNFLKSRN